MLLSTFHSLMQSKGIVLLSESRYSQRQYTMCRKLKSNFPKEKETAPQFSRWTWEFESSSTKQVAHQWDTENLLVDMVTKGTRAQLSLPPWMVQVHHLWTSKVRDMTDCQHVSEKSEHPTVTLALENPSLLLWFSVCSMGAMLPPYRTRMFILKRLNYSCTTEAEQSKKRTHRIWAPRLHSFCSIIKKSKTRCMLTSTWNHAV